MQAPLFVRPLTQQEQAELEAGRRSSQGFTVRRSPMLVASAQAKPTTTIARLMGCNDQTVRHAIHAFHQRGLAALQPKSSRPHTTPEVFDEEGREPLRARLASESSSLWQGHQHLDALPGSPGELHQRSSQPTDQWRTHPQCAQASGRAVETRQARRSPVLIPTPSGKKPAGIA